MSKSTLIGAAVFAVPAGFVLANVLQYVVGIPLPWNPYAALSDAVQGTPWRYLYELVIVASPIAAFGLLLLPNVHISRSQLEGELANIVIRRGTASVMLLMLGCVLVLAIMGAYFFSENLPCILGQQISC